MNAIQKKVNNMSVDINGLTKYLSQQTYMSFLGGHDIVERWKPVHGKNVGDYIMLDYTGGELSLCVRTERGHRVPGSSRILKLYRIAVLIEDTSICYGEHINGIWLVPEQFLICNVQSKPNNNEQHYKGATQCLLL